MFDFERIQIWGVAAAALASFALGALWFSPVLFGKTWKESLEAGGGKPGSPALSLPLFLVQSFASAFALALTFLLGDVDTLGRGALVGALVGIGIVGLSSLSDAAFPGTLRRWRMLEIAFRALAFVLMGAILGVSAKPSPVRAMERRLESVRGNLQEGLRKASEDLGKALEDR